MHSGRPLVQFTDIVSEENEVPRIGHVTSVADLEHVTFRATDEQFTALESLVDDEVYSTRSEALRAGVQQLLQRHRLTETDHDDQ